MKKLMLLFAFICVHSWLIASLMPLPSTSVPGSGKLIIDSTFTVAAGRYSDPRLASAISRFTSRVSRQTGIPMLGSATKPTLLVECRERGPEYPSLGEDESYRLDITADGARLEAPTVTGALRGLETFAQLIAPGAEAFAAPAIHVEDHPRFPWRGLMLDVSRHWLPVQVLECNLDAMAAVKLNVFHWHLSDDQGFRIESKRFPRLQQFGSDGNFYSQEEVRQVIDYARDRGIRVIPEFDMPGHTTSWFVGYPDLASAYRSYAIERKWGIFQPTMDPTREETYAFLDDFIGEMAALFPDRYFHIGGDEVEDTQWKASASIQAFARQHQLSGSRGLQAYFNRRVQELLKKHGKTMVGWDEILDTGLAQDTVIQSWRGQASLADAARKGYRGVLSFGYYLDHLKPASFHYAVDPLDDAEQTSRILGGEACMWSEYVSADTVDSRTWPRMAAIAERFWSPREVTNVESMYERMESISRMLEWTGVQHRSSYAPMLDRLTGGRSSEPLRILADASESAGVQVRRDTHKYTSQIPLNRFVDAVPPESETVRRMELAAKSLEFAELRVRFTEWAENDSRLESLIQGNFLISELTALSKDLSKAGSIGLHALDYLRNGQPIPEDWISQQTRSLDAISQPSAEAVLGAVRPVRILLDALSRKSHRGNDK